MLSATQRCAHGPLGLFPLPEGGGSRWACTFCRDEALCSDHRGTATEAEQEQGSGDTKWVDVISNQDCEDSAAKKNKVWSKKRQADCIEAGASWCLECAAPLDECADREQHGSNEGWRHIGELLRTRSDNRSNAQYFFDDESVSR